MHAFTAYGYQTIALAAQQEEEHVYPCPTCGGIGFLGQNLTQPCRTCGTAGEVPERPARTEERTPWPAASSDPWALPSLPDTDPPF